MITDRILIIFIHYLKKKLVKMLISKALLIYQSNSDPLIMKEYSL